MCRIALSLDQAEVHFSALREAWRLPAEPQVPAFIGRAETTELAKSPNSRLYPTFERTSRAQELRQEENERDDDQVWSDRSIDKEKTDPKRTNSQENSSRRPSHVQLCSIRVCFMMVTIFAAVSKEEWQERGDQTV